MFFPEFFWSRGGRLRLDAGQLLYYGVLTIHEQGQTRFCRAEIRPYCVDPLDHTESMLCGSFLVWPHFCSGKTARPLPTMDLRVIFVFLDADGARQDETDKKRRKDTLSGVLALVHRWYVVGTLLSGSSFLFCLRRHTFCQQQQKVCKKRRLKPMVSRLPLLSRVSFVMGHSGN